MVYPAAGIAQAEAAAGWIELRWLRLRYQAAHRPVVGCCAPSRCRVSTGVVVDREAASSSRQGAAH